MAESEQLVSISSKVVVCTLCGLSKSRTHAVPGEGGDNSKLLILGEAPGRYEDASGRPFVGMAGKFLDKYLEAAGIRREDAFVTNVVKCRPPKNRKPKDFEIKACRPYLLGQIRSISPSLILALGKTACEGLDIDVDKLLQITGKIMKIKFGGEDFTVLAAFHPSFPMRFKSKRDRFLADLKAAKAYLDSVQS
jgi:DNA polymerase